jgi:hypothetical protein
MNFLEETFDDAYVDVDELVTKYEQDEESNFNSLYKEQYND